MGSYFGFLTIFAVIVISCVVKKISFTLAKSGVGQEQHFFSPGLFPIRP
jgi:hypothetical protein